MLLKRTITHSQNCQLQNQSKALTGKWTLFHPIVSRTAFVSPGVCAIKTGSDGSDLLRKPTASSEQDFRRRKGGRRSEGFVDWEDRILEDTVPLVGFVRMILHSDSMKELVGDRLLVYHPDFDKKIGCWVSS
uniref:Uncharacterized protein n=1 Tax=Salix viminalis TaxID=40686 RepID=A0A6N2MKT3_SALVM